MSRLTDTQLIILSAALGCIYIFSRLGIVKTIALSGVVFYVFSNYSVSDLMFKFNCSGLPDAHVCGQLVQQGWTRGQIHQAYGYRRTDDEGGYVFTRKTPDLSVRSRWQSTGNAVEDFLNKMGDLRVTF